MGARAGLAIAAVCVALVATGCEAPKAYVNDVTGGRRAKLLAVDGQPVERVRSKYVTRIPFALVTPGSHTFRVRLAAESGAPEETLLISESVAAGKKYRFEESEGAIRLVEETDRHLGTVPWRGYALEEVRGLADLPKTIRSALGVDLPGTEGVADRGGRFNLTDVVFKDVPMRRLLAAGRQGDTWLVALERGGRAYSVEVFLFSGREATPKEKWVLLERPKTLRDVVQQLPQRAP
jgi:hypothetical protein